MDNRTVYCGNVQWLSLSYVEVRPLYKFEQRDHDTNDVEDDPSLTGAFIKRQLIIDTHRSTIMSRLPVDTPTIVMNTPTITPLETKTGIKYLISGLLMRLPTNNNENEDEEEEEDNEQKITQPSTTTGSTGSLDDDQSVLLWLTTNEPFGPSTVWPCHCIGYAMLDHSIDVSLHTMLIQQYQYRPVIVTESTLVVVIPSIGNHDDNNTQLQHSPHRMDHINNNNNYNKIPWNNIWTGEVAVPYQSQQQYDTIIQTQNTMTIAELKFRIQRLLSNPIFIGTTTTTTTTPKYPYRSGTFHHHQNYDGYQSRASKIRSSIVMSTRSTTQHISNNNNNNNNNNNSDPPMTRDANTLNNRRNSHNRTVPPPPQQQQPSSLSSSNVSNLLRDVALLVHSSNQNDNKTGIIEAIISSLSLDNGNNHRNNIKIHLIQPGILFAKYGIYTDIALQCIVHTIILQAAVRQQRICIIFDHFNSMILSSEANSRDNGGDAAIPILQSMTSFIQTLLLSIQNDHVIPFPRNNPLYNYNSTNTGFGMMLPVHVCFIAVMTCPDSRRWLTDETHHGNVTQLSGMGLYRLPNLTSETRLKAFRYVFHQEGIVLSKELEIKLPYLAAAAAIWARGVTTFQLIAKQVRHRIVHRYSDVSLPSNNIESDHSVLVATLDDVEKVFHVMQRTVGGRLAAGCDVQFLTENNNADNNNDDSLFHTVGGNQEAKASLLDALSLDPIQRNLLTSFGIAPSTGVLLYGPPGTGKTLLAKAVAKALRSRSSSIGGAFIALNSSDIVRAEVGASEKLVAQAFHTALTNSPSVIFIDEFQALFTERSSGSSSRLTTTLLQCMDDLQRLGNIDNKGNSDLSNGANSDVARVLVLAATNTPWMIDRAFLRPGRFDRSVLVNLPNFDERISILTLHVKRMKTTLNSESTEQQALFFTELAHRTDGFSGADLAALCRGAAIRCLVDRSEFVTETHFFEVLDDGLKASSSISLVHKIEQWRP